MPHLLARRALDLRREWADRADAGDADHFNYTLLLLDCEPKDLQDPNAAVRGEARGGDDSVRSSALSADAGSGRAPHSGPGSDRREGTGFIRTGGRCQAESTYDATHLSMVEAKQARAAALPAPTLATVFEVVIGGAYIASPDRRCSAGSERRNRPNSPEGYLFSNRPNLE